MFAIGQKNGFATTRLSRKDSPLNGNILTFRQIKKFLEQRSVKELMLTVLLDMKRPINIDFIEKGATVNIALF